jgi:hypothetical protein
MKTAAMHVSPLHSPVARERAGRPCARSLRMATRGSAVVHPMTFDDADSCPSRLAAAVAEQQCNETLRGGRTQLDVDGAVSRDRF